MSKRSLRLPALALTGLLVCGAAFVLWSRPTEHDAALAAADVPRYGLAARYPGDKGIAADPAVVFHEDFEGGSSAAVVERWTSGANAFSDGRMSLEPDSAEGLPGGASLKMTIVKGQSDGAGLYKLLDQKYGQLYARFYCRFAEDAPYVHHFVHLGGKVSTSPWPEGNAGNRPSGYDRFSTSIDLRPSGANPPGAWIFYTYWSEMHSWQTPQGESDGRASAFYGNEFGPPKERPSQAKRGQWQCVEMMIKLNSSPEERDGEQAVWVDGKLVTHWFPGSHMGQWYGDRFREYGTDVYQLGGTVDSIPKPFEGYLWSKTPELKINQFELQYYLANIFANNVRPPDSTIVYNGELGRVEFDDVVLATSYIGPIAADGWTRNDFDGDGRPSYGDVLELLKIRTLEPDDLRTDYDLDGRLTLMEVLHMFFDIRRLNQS